MVAFRQESSRSLNPPPVFMSPPTFLSTLSFHSITIASFLYSSCSGSNFPKKQSSTLQSLNTSFILVFRPRPNLDLLVRTPELFRISNTLYHTFDLLRQSLNLTAKNHTKPR